MNELNSRRSFFKKITKGIALSAFAFSSSDFIGYEQDKLHDNLETDYQKPLKLGIVGGSVSAHTFDFGKLFNIDKKFPGVELLYAWADTEEFARDVREKARIPNIVKDPDEMIGKIDALIINHRDGKYHLKPAIPFIRAGIPTFVDKPFSNSVTEAREFLAFARSSGTPVTTWSTIAQSEKTLDLKRQVEKMGKINNLVCFGPVDIESPWGGIHFYGVHSVDPLLYIFGDNVTKVRVSRNGTTATGTLLFSNGMLATLIFMTQARNTPVYAETKNGLLELKSDVREKDPPKCYTDMVDMFRTGREPRSHKSILHSVAVLEALERSVSSDRWEDVISQL
jgi:predicted dehydrogenase